MRSAGRLLCGPVVLGVDPGNTGGVALVQPHPGKGKALFFDGWRVPLVKHSAKSTRVDGGALYDRLRTVVARKSLDVVGAVVENVHSMPGQGVASTFTFGRSLGTAETVAKICCSDVVYVAPQTWKKHYGFTKGSGKRASLQRARAELNGFDSDALADNGIAEAALMALWRIQTDGDNQDTRR